MRDLVERFRTGPPQSRAAREADGPAQMWWKVDGGAGSRASSALGGPFSDGLLGGGDDDEMIDAMPLCVRMRARPA